ELSSYYEFLGDSQKAYDANLEALKLTTKWQQATPEDYGLIENNLGTLANRKGDLAKGLEHHKKALKFYESYSKTDKTNLYVIYNSLGGSMWYISKIDSALYFYKKADKTLKLLEPNPINSYYRPAILQNNIAGIYASQGNLDKALESMKLAINFITEFLKSDASDIKKEAAKEFLFQGIENYAGIYKDMGNFEKAKELLEYAYKEKQKQFKAKNPELFKAKILLGQIYLALKDYKRSEQFLDDGLAHIEMTDGDNYFWAADAYYYKASLNEELGKNTIAKQNYAVAEQYYEAALNGAYDALYLDFIIKASHFYAKNNDKSKALNMAEKAYTYIKANQGVTTSFEIQQALNLGEIHYELGDYDLAFQKGTATLELLKKILPTQTNPSDSTQILFYKPQAILLKSQAAYKLQTKKELSFLKNEFNNIEEAITIVERQKILVGNENNVSFLIADNTQLFEFAKQLALELYEATKDQTYLNKVIGLNESILYNNIRAHLNSRSSMVYNDVPQAILNQEKTIQKALQKDLDTDDAMSHYFKLENDWKAYLEMLKTKYPKYYKLRFASIFKSLANLSEKVPKNSTIVRYTYIDNQLYAIVISKEASHIYKLNQDQITNAIEKLQEGSTLFENQFEILHTLYAKLWSPFENDIKTEHVIIIPDRALFNLSFEMLTPKQAKSYAELATNSLLSKYVISYNYSLFLIDKDSKITDYKDNFVAFAPEFNDKMKTEYEIAIRDSLNLDKTYLTLLPQPFTKRLAQKSTRLFKGTSFLNEKSTKHIFESSAKEHKIIYIGTHAESNNVTPELSRLVFAKALDSTNTDDNYLYTYEIYNTNLSSNLAILTACETGKPTYQAGEGMISLANAFNYAGSESILTSLWKIDEQSSAEIVDLFYKNIKKGWSKDKALQQAKLDYMARAKGRAINPQYWAGLVLIGDTSPIALTSSSSLIYWLLGGFVIILFLFYFIKNKKA
ncbi:MAG: CHAT domain-containing protein, partial [Gelidibacter sp.]|nr:CHAT domain-containing protein [Gelidibacter sp.]